jgi:hypothetical protein
MDRDEISELVPQVVLPIADHMVQLLQDFQSMFTNQKQDRITDHMDRKRFKSNIKGLMAYRSQQSGSDSLSVQFVPLVHVGQYDAPPDLEP